MSSHTKKLTWRPQCESRFNVRRVNEEEEKEGEGEEESFLERCQLL